MSKNFDIAKAINEEAAKYGSIAGKSIIVGLPDDRIHNPSGLTYAELGAIHEFGQGDIPERSFLRGSMTANKDMVRRILEKTAKNVSSGAEANKEMDKLALWAQGTVQEYISNGATNFEQLARPRKDGSKNPLNDTGALRQGIIGITVEE